MERARTSDLAPIKEKVSDSRTGSRLADQFSLVEGGPIYRFQRAIRMALPDRSGVVKRALLTTLVTFAISPGSLKRNRFFVFPID